MDNYQDINDDADLDVRKHTIRVDDTVGHFALGRYERTRVTINRAYAEWCKRRGLSEREYATKWGEEHV